MLCSVGVDRYTLSIILTQKKGVDSVLGTMPIVSFSAFKTGHIMRCSSITSLIQYSVGTQWGTYLLPSYGESSCSRHSNVLE